MDKTLSLQIEHDLTTCNSRALWNPFMQAVEKYCLIQPGDCIAVCVSGGKDSMLLAKLMQLLARQGKIPFSLRFLSMDPGYLPQVRSQIEANAAALDISLTWFETNLFRAVDQEKGNPCFLCSRLRRGSLYRQAQELGCNKIALGHHFNDVIETILMGMLYGGQVQTMLPRIKAANFPGMELIRPLYLVKEREILRWRDTYGLEFLRCSCRFAAGETAISLKRGEVKALIAALSAKNPQVEQNIFNSVKNVDTHKILGYHIGKECHTFLEEFFVENPDRPIDSWKML